MFSLQPDYPIKKIAKLECLFITMTPEKKTEIHTNVL